MKKTILALFLSSAAAFSQTITLDETFNVGTGTDFSVIDIEHAGNGKIIIAGNFSHYNGYAAPGIARLNADGSYDESFNAEFDNNYFADVVVEDDGKVVAAGEFSGIYRFNEDGSLDDSFSASLGGGLGPYTIAKQGDKYLVGGDFSAFHPEGLFYRGLVRLNYDGSVDPTFAETDFGNTPGYIRVKLQEDGKILVVGSFEYYNGETVNNIIRLDANGAIDNSFEPGTGPAGMVREAVQYENGKYLISGYFTSYDGISAKFIARLNEDGSMDDTFNYVPGAGLAEDGIIGDKLIIQEDGKILIGGVFFDANIDIEGTPDGSIPFYFAQLNADGSTNTSFNTGTGFNDRVFTLTVQDDGKILAGGLFTMFNGTAQQNLARLNVEALSLPGNALASLSFYPNPVNTNLFISGDAIKAQNTSITVYDVLGKSIYSSEVSMSATAVIDMAAYRSGIYYVQIVSDGKIKTAKIIKK